MRIGVGADAGKLLVTVTILEAVGDGETIGFVPTMRIRVGVGDCVAACENAPADEKIIRINPIKTFDFIMLRFGDLKFRARLFVEFLT